MEKDRILVSGKILFDPDDHTKKHIAQSSWKRIAMIMVDGEVSEYYSWFIKKRFNLVLNKPIRGSHVSFINDSMRDLSLNGTYTDDQIQIRWEGVKERWNDKIFEVSLYTNARTDGKHWWLNVTDESRADLQQIRSELGLNKPFFGMHLTIGYANERNIDHSNYIHGLIKSGLII